MIVKLMQALELSIQKICRVYFATLVEEISAMLQHILHQAPVSTKQHDHKQNLKQNRILNKIKLEK